MLSNLRNFSKSRYSGVLVFIIIIPFVLWGMGSVFSGGNTNIIAKIDNQNISAEELINNVNSRGIDINYLKSNIDENILEDILQEIISTTILDQEIDKMKIKISDKSLVKKIKSDEKFLDFDKNFSRIKYEKFLIENNLSAVNFEKRLKDQELQKKFFFYISGGINSPKFIVDRYFADENKKITINYINLQKNYKNEFSDEEIREFIEKNRENLEKEYIDFSYSIIKPEDLTNSQEFSDNFFEKIDEIENLVFDKKKITQIENLYKINLVKKSNLTSSKNLNDIEKEIYKNRNKSKIQLLEKSDYFLLFEIENITKKIPSIDDIEFKKEILNRLRIKAKFDFNRDLNEKIENNKFNDSDFLKIALGKENIKKLNINSIKDINRFTKESIKFVYSMPKNSFLMIADFDKNIYLAKIIGLEFKNINFEDENYKNYYQLLDIKLINNLFTSYDQHLNNKYEIKIYDNNLEKVKDYFK